MNTVIRMLCIFLLLMSSAAALADYEAQRKAAESHAASDPARAVQDLIALGERSADPAQQADSFRRAALLLNRAGKDHMDAALRLAQRIPLPSQAALTQMELLQAWRQWPRLLEQFGDVSLDSWPTDDRGAAHRLRGEAAYQTAQADLAQRELTRAAEHLTFDLAKAGALLLLGDTHRDLKQDPQAAIEAYRQAFTATARLQVRVPAVCNVASILLDQQRASDALAEMRRVDWQAARESRYAVQYFTVLARVLEASGHRDDAVATYREVLAMPSLSAATAAQMQGHIERLLLTATDTLVLAAQGQCEYQVVIPDSAATDDLHRLLRESADLIAKAFAANGFAVPVVTESQRDAAKPGIYLGRTGFAEAQGVAFDALRDWSYVHRVVGRDLILAGNDVPHPGQLAGLKTSQGQPIMGARAGTIKAATDFLHRYVRTRFLYPNGDTGVEFMPQPAIAVPGDLDAIIVPKLIFSSARTWGNDGARTPLVAGRDLYSIANNYFPITQLDWKVHTYDRAIPVEKYTQTHPEYFALIGNSRTKDNDYCISNPAVQQLIYQDLLHQLDAGYAMTNLGQQDGFNACTCEPCRKLYDTGDDWREKLWLFHRDLALRLKRERPEARVLLLAYDRTWLPPQSFREFPDNVIVLLTRWHDEWKQYRVPGGFAGYLYLWGTYSPQAYTPKQTPASVAAMVRRAHRDFGARAFYFDGFGTGFGLEGPAYYTFGRLWDDPDRLETRDVLEEYYDAAFGAAAGPMRRFFSVLHRSVDFYINLPASYVDEYGRNQPFMDRDPMRVMRMMYPADALGEMDARLKQAQDIAENDKVRRRLALVRIEFEYLRHIVTVAHLDEAFRVAPDSGSRDRLLAAIDAWNAFLGPRWFRWDDKAGRWGSGQHPNQIPGWPEFRPFKGDSRHAVALTQSHHGAAYADTPLNWDIRAMRRAPLPGARQLLIAPAEGSVTLDGPQWPHAPEQRLQAGSIITTFRALYDAQRLYLRFESTLPPGVTTFAAVDDQTDANQAQSIHVVLDPTASRQRYLRFTVGVDEKSRQEAALGLIADMVHPLYGKEDAAWQGEWSYVSQLDLSKGTWRALVSIPYATLGVEAPQPGVTWLGNFARTLVDERDRTEQLTWSTKPGVDHVTQPGALAELRFIAAGESKARVKHPLQNRREELYARTFDLPADWKQMPDPLPDGLGPWYFREDAADRGVSEQWFATPLQLDQWRPIAVPAFWAETDVADYFGYGWYLTRFRIPAEWNGRGLRLMFGAVDEQAWVYLNGTLIGEHSEASSGVPAMQLWDKPFECSAAPNLVKTGDDNVLMIRVHNSRANGGIWRPVRVHARQESQP